MTCVVCSSLVLFVASLAACVSSATVNCPPAANTRPIIGIVTEPTYGPKAKLGAEYIAASYVKWVESGGARVVPIRYNSTSDQLHELFRQINGVLFPGGAVYLEGRFMATLQTIYNMALEANLRGDYFPLWGTCLGFEALVQLVAGSGSPITKFNASNISLSLTMTGQESRLFGQAPETVVRTFAERNVTMNVHTRGVSPASFFDVPLLKEAFRVLSTSRDRDGHEFVSTIEGISLPFFGVQWHPEKPLFEWWSKEVISHSSESVLANSYTAQFFVNEARRNKHRFDNEKAEADQLIYNTSPTYTAAVDPQYQQCYFFS